jgi:two-component system, cell cycle response regulator
LAILDIDRFKDCNDKSGHNSGDRVLVSLAGAMTSDSRQIDTSFRYGDDEFAIIMPETDSGGARGVVERIRLKWLEILRTESLGLEDLLGLSAGIGEFPRDAAAQDSLVLLVDAALYSAKRSGGSRSILVSEMGERPHDMPSSSPSDQV